MAGVPIERLPQLVNANEALKRLGRFCSLEFVIGVGDVPHHVVVDQGVIREVVSGPFKMRAYSFAIHASEAAWQEFTSPIPRPGFHDIFAMSSCGHARIEGDMAPLLHNLRFIKEVLACLRRKGD